MTLHAFKGCWAYEVQIGQLVIQFRLHDAPKLSAPFGGIQIGRLYIWRDHYGTFLRRPR